LVSPGGGKKAGSSSNSAEDTPASATSPEFNLKEAVEKPMSQAVHHLQTELANIRSGRANPGLLEPIMVRVKF
jgi:hypothetical protein